MWHKQSFTQFWSQSDAYSRRSSLKLTYIHHPLVVCTHQICCAVAVPIALSQDRRLHGHNRLVNWTPCSRMRESKLKISFGIRNEVEVQGQSSPELTRILTVLKCICCLNSEILEGQGQLPPKTIGILTKVFCFSGPNLVILAWTDGELSCGQASDWYTHTHRHRQLQYPEAKTGLG